MTSTEPRRVATPVIAAAALFVDDDTRVMLVRPNYKSHWDLPGGYAESGEAPRAACRRELIEELGLDTPVGKLLSVDWAPHPDEGDKILFIFDGGRLTVDQLREIRFVDGEITEFRFISPQELTQFTVPRLVRRIHSTLDTLMKHKAGTYLEDGNVPA